MQKETYYQLLAKYLENSLSKSEEEALFLEWEQNPDEKAIFDKIDRFRYTQTLSPDAIENQLNKVLESIDTSHDKKIKWYSFAKYTAVAASFLCVVFFSYKYFTKTRATSIENIVDGKKVYNSKLPQKLELPDKSIVVLGANSSIVWDTIQFGKKVRELYLKGEGYFDVTSNKKVPFIVHTSYGSIKVLGTAFHVKAYAEKNSVFKTVLYRGKIELTLDDDTKKSFTLLPNDKVNIPIANHKLSHIEHASIVHINNDEIHQDTAWLQNSFVWDNTPLSEIAQDLENFYNIKINIQDAEIANYKITGTIANDKPLGKVLDLITITRNIHYQVNQNSKEVTITK